MKYDITQDDKDIMEFDFKHDRTLKHLRNLSFYKFSIGDVLIREEKYRTDGKDQWRVKVADCGLPNKYLYAYENSLGVGYIRRLSINGRKFVDKATCVTQFDPDQTRFVLDPEYADHMLLASENDDFDAKSRYDDIKKKKEKVNRQNKKMRTTFVDEAAVKNWMKTLKRGDQFWFSHSLSRISKNPYVIDAIHLDIRRQSLWNNTETISYVSVTGGNYNTQLYPSSFITGYLFLSRPTFADEVIS
jgi:hypothetical protein